MSVLLKNSEFHDEKSKHNTQSSIFVGGNVFGLSKFENNKWMCMQYSRECFVSNPIRTKYSAKEGDKQNKDGRQHFQKKPTVPYLCACYTHINNAHVLVCASHDPMLGYLNVNS